MSGGGPADDDGSEARRKLRHDLRTPISQILGYAELLQEEASEQGRSLPDLARIESAARTLLGQLERVLPELSHAPPSSMGAEEEAQAASQRRAPPRDEPVAGDARGTGRILVVDDNPANRDMLSRRLALRGYDVACAEDGVDALARLEAERFDLVLLDVMMPGISGVEVLRRVRERLGPADLPVIMATARDHSGDVVEALAAGANDYVTKPLDFPVVQARVQTQLGLKRAKDEIHRLVDELEVRNRFISQVFGRYVSEEVAATLLQSPERLRLGGEIRNVTVMMSDLRGFTAIAERLQPEQVVFLLNNYLGSMADLIQAHGGTVDEFLGDGILAVFGAPVAASVDDETDALRAVACAVAMQRAMLEVNAFNRAHDLPELEMGIAVHTGDAVVGNIGSQKRAKYGVVGAPVNLTARIEASTVGGEILISESTLLQAGAAVEVGAERAVSAKGVSEPIRVHSVRAVGGRRGGRVPVYEEHFASLGEPVDVELSLLAGKHVGADRLAARLVALSERGARLSCDAPLEALSNVRLRLAPSAAGPAGDVYAKVTGTDGALSTLRFTSVPRAIATWLAERRDVGAAAAVNSTP